MEGLLIDNIFFVYLLGILVIINYEAFDKKQKIAIIYACGFGLAFSGDLKYTIILTLLLFILFLYEEYLNEDLVKIKYVTKIRYKCLDFIFMYIFQYKILYVVTAIILKANINSIVTVLMSTINNVSQAALENIWLTVSILLLIIGVHKIFNNPVEIKSFKQINQKFSLKPYYNLPLKDEQERKNLFTKLELVADVEDYTFFIRKKSYSALSIEFFKAVYEKKKSQKETVKTAEKKWLKFLWRKFIHIANYKKVLQFCKTPYKIKVIKKIIKWLYIKLVATFANLIRKCKKRIKRYIRGYSTIEMEAVNFSVSMEEKSFW